MTQPLYSLHPSDPPGPVQRFVSTLLRVALLVGGVLLMFGALMLALLLAGGALLWALLRARRPDAVNLRWNTVHRPSGFARRADRVEVVDVQVREIDDIDNPAPQATRPSQPTTQTTPPG